MNAPARALAVVVPCFNPSEGWENALAQNFFALREALSARGLAAELVVVNDGSTRHFSPENRARLMAAVPGVRLLEHAPNRGKGYALRQGVAAAEADFYLLTDVDFPYTLPSMVRVAEVLAEKGGIAAGNRDTDYYATVPFFRKILSQLLRWLLRRVVRLPLTDSQCGLKGFDRAGRDIFLRARIDRFLFDLEFLMLARDSTVPVAPVPVALRAGVVFSKVGWRVLAAEGWNFFKLVALG